MFINAHEFNNWDNIFISCPINYQMNIYSFLSNKTETCIKNPTHPHRYPSTATRITFLSWKSGDLLRFYRNKEKKFTSLISTCSINLLFCFRTNWENFLRQDHRGLSTFYVSPPLSKVGDVEIGGDLLKQYFWVGLIYRFSCCTDLKEFISISNYFLS